MPDTEIKRVRRTTEERIAEVDAKIEELDKQIQNLEEKKQETVAVQEGKNPGFDEAGAKGRSEAGGDCRAFGPHYPGLMK